MVFSVISMIVVARYLGDARFGKFAFAISYNAIFAVLSNLNLGTLAARDVARNRTLANTYLTNVLWLRGILGAIIFALSCLLVNSLGRPHEVILITYVLAISMFLNTLSTGLRWWFQAFQRLEYEGALTTIGSGAMLAGNLIAVFLGAKLLTFAWVAVFSEGLMLAAALLLTYRTFSRLTWKLDPTFLTNLFKRNIPFALIAIFSALYLNIDRIMLSMLKGDAITGSYTAAVRLVSTLKFLPIAYSASIFPVLSGFFGSNRRAFERVMEKTFQLMLVICLPLALGTTIISEKIVSLCLGPQFTHAAPALQVLIWATVCMFMSLSLGQALLSTGYQTFNAAIIGTGLCINIVANFLLIPRLAHIGASISILLTELFILVVTIGWAYRTSIFRIPRLFVSKVVLATSIMGIFTYFAKTLNLVIVVPCSIAVYFVALGFAAVMSAEDKALINNLFHRKLTYPFSE